ncbi:hypothetical protein T492DRAFT_891798 [Pavlovales sp. CCMP2436]|nr:hypothetical protein T492DRAFT_891798 [Pavlovales sp. CCMP2436]
MEVADSSAYNSFARQPDGLPRERARSGRFRTGGKGAVERAVAHVARNAKAAIARVERARVAAAYDQSVAEVSQGLARGPLPRSEVERHNFEWLHPIPRGTILKGETGDNWRAIDDARWSKHNEAIGLHETLTCVCADFPGLVCEEGWNGEAEDEDEETDDLEAGELHVKLGMPLSLPKHLNLAPINVFLGVLSDLSQAHLRGVVTVTMRVSERRREKVCALIERYLASGALGRTKAASLRGKLLFSAYPCFGNVGKPALRVLASWQYRPRQRLTTGLRNDEGGSDFPAHVAEALSFFLKLVESHPEAVLHVWPRHGPPVVILTDAMQEGTRAGLAFVASYPSLIPGGAAVVEFGGQLIPNNLVLEHAEYGNPLRCITMLEALAALAVVEGEQGERLRAHRPGAARNKRGVGEGPKPDAANAERGGKRPHG